MAQRLTQIDITLNRKINIEQHEPSSKMGVRPDAAEG